MTEKFIDSLHWPSGEITEDSIGKMKRGAIIFNIKTNEGGVMVDVIFALEDPDLAPRLFDSEQFGILGYNLIPEKFGLRRIWVEDLPKPYRKKWLAELERRRSSMKEEE